MKYSTRTQVIGSLLGLALHGALVSGCASPEEPPAQKRRADIGDAAERASKIEREMMPTDAVQAREGIAAVVLVDVSRSMWTAIIDSRSPLTVSSEIVIANRAVMNLVRQFDQHAVAHPDEPVLLGLFAFGGQGGPSAREVIALSPPDPARTERALPRLADDDRTAIGDAMIAGTRALDQTGMTRRHLFVFTDGANTAGYDPAEVMAALMRRPEAERPHVYVVTFDVAASPFEAVRKRGGRVLAAANTQELNVTVEFLLTGRILVERP